MIAAGFSAQNQLARGARVYIAGPMSGLPDFNYPAFNQAEDVLRDLGFYPRNPAKNGLPAGSAWSDHMRADIRMLTTCDAVFMLKDWQQSRGATLEHHIAQTLGLHIVYQQQEQEARAA